MQLQIFKFQSPEERQMNEITTIEIEGEIWFVASDICNTLGLSNPSEALKGLDDDEKLTSELLRAGQKRKVNLVSESGLYGLIFRSRKPSALKFRKWITKEVIPSIRKKGYYGKIDRTALPNFIERYKDNYHKIPKTHFSVISEMFARMYIELEKVGYVIPDRGIDGKKLVPDISVGLGFAKFLKKNDSEYYGTALKYKHKYPDGREVDANMYHIDALPMFIRYINEVWIPENAESYFRERDPLALDYLPKLLGTGS